MHEKHKLRTMATFDLRVAIVVFYLCYYNTEGLLMSARNDLRVLMRQPLL